LTGGGYIYIVLGEGWGLNIFDQKLQVLQNFKHKKKVAILPTPQPLPIPY